MTLINGYLSLLNEKNDKLIEIGLNKILEHVDLEWA